MENTSEQQTIISLKEIYKDIDALEKSKIEVTEFHKRSEEFFIFCIMGFITSIIRLYFTNHLFKTDSLNVKIRTYRIFEISSLEFLLSYLLYYLL